MRHVKFYPQLPQPVRLLLFILALVTLQGRESAQAQSAGGCAVPRFSEAATFTAGINPRALAVADFNGDGKADAAVANQLSHNLSVFLGTGGGGFSAPVNYTVASQPHEIAAADFNGDGRVDLAVAGFTGQGITLLLNDGAGNFTASTVGTGGNTPSGLTSADFNNDGRVDLAAPDSSSRIMVMLNAGGGAFNAPASTFVAADAGRLAAADVNKDGKQDLVVADRGFSRRALFVVLGDGAGGFGAPTVYSLNALPFALILGDVDADSDLDIITTTVDRDVLLLRGDGAGGFAAASTIATGATPRKGIIRDLDGDGRADLALAFGGGSQGENGSVGVMFGTGGGNFAAPVHYHTGTGTYAVAASDFDSDNTPDLVAINNGNSSSAPSNMALLLNEGNGVFGASTFFFVGGGPATVLAADFNGDGHVDLASPHQSPSSLGVIYGDGAGRFTAPTDFAFTGFPDSAATDDLNADGRADVIVTTQSPDAVYVFLGGAAGFGTPTTLAAGAIPYGVAVDDYNGDGKKDLAVANPASGTVSILLGNGAGGFSGPTNVALEGEPRSVASGDFNGDGKRDLAVTPGGPFTVRQRVAILLGAGDGTFTRGANVMASNNAFPRHVTVADFNKDGKQDLAIAYSNPGFAAVALGNGDGTFAAVTQYGVVNSPTHISVGDLNGDGALDLVLPTFSASGVAVLAGTAAGTFGQPSYYPAGQGPEEAVIADLNGDGKSDIATNAGFSNYITVLRNTCATATAPGTVQFGAATYNAGEGAGGASVSVTRSGDASGTVTINYATSNGSATAGADYTAASGTLTFGPGEAVKTFTVPILEDTAVEGGETVFLQLSDPGGGATLGTPSTAELRIADNDSCAYGVSPASLPEFDATGGRATLQIIANVGCSWSSTSGANWIRPTAVWSGSGPGAITFDVLPNQGPARVGGITLTNGVQYEIRQAGVAPAVRFSQPSYTAREGDARATVQIERNGDTSAPLAVTIQTVDDQAAVRCDVRTGKAYARCDYATTIEIVTFAAGDAQPKSVTIPLVDDGHDDGFETIVVKLTDPVGGILIDRSTAHVTVEDNDAGGAPNPISGNAFFVRMHYLDFLSREPEAGEPWTGVLDRCPNVNNTDPNAVSALCDRLLVSKSFFESLEFQLKGLYSYFFYRVAFDRRPAYDEITPDMRSLAGATPQEVFARRAQYATAITQRAEFARLYGAATNAQYVDALLGRNGLAQITTENPQDFEGAAQVTLTRQQLIDALNNNSLSRAQVLRAVVQSSEVDSAEYHGAFVSMQYYGYLRRTPEQSGYDSWLRVIRQDPGNVRLMVDGFMNSQEYRLRYGQP